MNKTQTASKFERISHGYFTWGHAFNYRRWRPVTPIEIANRLSPAQWSHCITAKLDATNHLTSHPSTETFNHALIWRHIKYAVHKSLLMKRKLDAHNTAFKVVTFYKEADCFYVQIKTNELASSFLSAASNATWIQAWLNWNPPCSILHASRIGKLPLHMPLGHTGEKQV